MYRYIRSNLNILDLLGPQKIPRYLKIWNIDGKILHEKVFEMFLTSNSLWYIHGTLLSEISFTCMLKKLKFNCNCILLHTSTVFVFYYIPLECLRMKKRFLILFYVYLSSCMKNEGILIHLHIEICIFIHFKFKVFLV